MKKHSLTTLAAFVLVLTSLGSASAATYLLDLNTQAGAAGTTWNSYDDPEDPSVPGDLTGLIKDTTGSTAAGISVTADGDIENSIGSGLYNDNGPDWVETDAGVGDDNAADDFFWTGNQTGATDPTSFTISFSGLTPGDTVSLDLFASRSSSNDLRAYYVYSLDGGISTGGFSVLDNTGAAVTEDGWDTNTTKTQLFNLDELGGYELGRYMNASSLTVGAGGTLDVTLNLPGASVYAGINAMQLTVIPEPSSLLLVALGFMGIFGLKRRKNRR